MATRTPPLTSLKVFEAAARHLSFKKAADELCVTPAAVSRQIGHLETIIGARLFLRLNQGLELTTAARLCLPKLQEGFECLRTAIEQMHHHVSSHPLKVVAAPSFAMRWLMPRLHRFSLLRPDIDVQVSTRLDPFGGRRRGEEYFQSWVESSDVVLMYAGDDFAQGLPELHVEPLLPLSITPLCSPRFLAGAQPMRQPADVLGQVLLHDDRGVVYGKKSYWRQWLDAAGVSGEPAEDGLHFTHSMMALEAALDGLGVVASTPALVEQELRTGALVAPFALDLPLHAGYQIVSDRQAARREDVAEFRLWLHGEVSRGGPAAPARASEAWAEAL